jgi:hypothetical protein
MNNNMRTIISPPLNYDGHVLLAIHYWSYITNHMLLIINYWSYVTSFNDNMFLVQKYEKTWSVTHLLQSQRSWWWQLLYKTNTPRPTRNQMLDWMQWTGTKPQNANPAIFTANVITLLKLPYSDKSLTLNVTEFLNKDISHVIQWLQWYERRHKSHNAAQILI